MIEKIKEIIPYSLIGVAAYMAADVIHEVIGHGGTCLIIGQKIKLLTSVYFRSQPGSIITDLGGPISNLFFGLLIFYFLRKKKNLSILPGLLLFLTMLYSFYWFSGTIIESSFSGSGDWTYLIKQLDLRGLGKIILIITGMAAYYFTIRVNYRQYNEIRLTYSEFPLKQFIYGSYIAAALAAVIAGLFFTPDRIMAAREGLLEMIASIPIIFIGAKDKLRIEAYNIKSNLNIFNFIVTILFIIFCFTLGQGFIL